MTATPVYLDGIKLLRDLCFDHQNNDEGISLKEYLLSANRFKTVLTWLRRHIAPLGAYGFSIVCVRHAHNDFRYHLRVGTGTHEYLGWMRRYNVTRLQSELDVVAKDVAFTDEHSVVGRAKRELHKYLSRLLEDGQDIADIPAPEVTDEEIVKEVEALLDNVMDVLRSEDLAA